MKEQPSRHSRILRAGTLLGLPVAGALALAACAPKQQEQPQPVPIARAAEPATQPPIPSEPGTTVRLPVVGREAVQTPTAEAKLPEPSPTPQPTPTEVPKPTVTPKVEFTATPVPEVKKEVPCQILPTEFCSQAERVMVSFASGTQFEYLAFNKLPVDTPIYSPVDGFLAFSREGGPQSPIVGFSVRMTNGAAGVKGNLRLKSVTQRDIKAGEIIGYTTETKTLGEHDLLITITKRADGGPVVDEDALRKLFPKAFEKPIIPAKQDSPVKPSVTALYGPNPPR